MVKAVERATEIGANALQIFSDNPTAWRRRAEPPAELPVFRERLREADITPLAIHASYLINLAGPANAFYEPSIELLNCPRAAVPTVDADAKSRNRDSGNEGQDCQTDHDLDQRESATIVARVAQAPSADHNRRRM